MGGFLGGLLNGNAVGNQQAYMAPANLLGPQNQYSAQNYNFNLTPNQQSQQAYSGQAGFLPGVSSLTNQINTAQNQTGAASANAYAPGTTANIGSLGNTAASYLSGQMSPTEQAAQNEYAQGPGGFSSQTQTPQMNAFNFQNQLVQQGANMNQQALNQTQQVNGPQANIGSNFQNMNQIGNTANQQMLMNTGLQNQMGNMNTSLNNSTNMYNNSLQNYNNQANATNSFINQQGSKTTGGFLPALQSSLGSQVTALGSASPGMMLGAAGF